MNKRLFLIGFVIVMLVMIPVTIKLVQMQTNIPIKAEQATTLTFIPPSAPITVGNNFKLGISLNPGGKNVVSFVKLIVTYDSTVLKQIDPGFEGYSTIFPVTLEQPTYNQCTGNTCTMSIAVSIGTQINNKVYGNIPKTIASVNFQAIAVPDSGSTTVEFGNGTQVLSLATGDSPSENVLSNASPVTLTIGAVPSTTPGATDTPTTAPTSEGGGTGGTGTGGTGGTGGNQTNPPTCSSLTADNTSTSSAPLSVLFTTSGASSVNPINKVTMNFGDGAVQDITTGGGIGTQTINTQATHIYQQEGVFTATATLTDSDGATSNPSSCSQTITVGNPPPGGNPTGTVGQGGKLPATGLGQTFLGIGIAGIVAIVGGLILFGL